MAGHDGHHGRHHNSHSRNTHSHHGHGHHHGHHGNHGSANERRVFWAMILTVTFVGAEVAGGLLSGSLALLADAGHMLTDAASLALAWLGFRLARRPADPERSYGYHRFEVLAAFVNGIALFAIAGWIVFEAATRLADPVPVLGATMLGFAALGLVVNLGAFVILIGGDRANLNIWGAALHVMGDLLGSVAAIGAALVILATGWTPIDPILSVLVALLILRSAWFIIRNSAHILLEGSPEDIDLDELRTAMPAAVPGVEEVHHVHAWSLTQEKPLVTLHARVRPDADHMAVLTGIKSYLHDRFAITHMTVQIEYGGCVDTKEDGGQENGGQETAPSTPPSSSFRPSR